MSEISASLYVTASTSPDASDCSGKIVGCGPPRMTWIAGFTVFATRATSRHRSVLVTKFAMSTASGAMCWMSRATAS